MLDGGNVPWQRELFPEQGIPSQINAKKAMDYILLAKLISVQVQRKLSLAGKSEILGESGQRGEQWDWKGRQLS